MNGDLVSGWRLVRELSKICIQVAAALWIVAIVRYFALPTRVRKIWHNRNNENKYRSPRRAAFRMMMVFAMCRYAVLALRG